MNTDEVETAILDPPIPLTVFPELAPLFGQKWGGSGKIAVKDVGSFPCCRCVGLQVCKTLQSTWVLCEAPDERDLVCWKARGFDVRELVEQLPTEVTTVTQAGGDGNVTKPTASVQGPKVNTKNDSEERWCSRCCQWKPITEFNRSQRDGWQARCRTCQNEYNRNPARRARWEENQLQKQVQRG